MKSTKRFKVGDNVISNGKDGINWGLLSIYLIQKVIKDGYIISQSTLKGKGQAFAFYLTTWAHTHLILRTKASILLYGENIK